MLANGSKHLGALLLDSSLITATQNKNVSIKIIECGEYYQVYQYNKPRLIKDKTIDKFTDKSYSIDLFKNVDTDNLCKSKNLSRIDEPKFIEYKNIQRSKFQVQRLVKANEQKFKTFITLTFADNVTSIADANKKFAVWRTKIKSIYKDFLYLCVPEFQKRGAVHYHLLTNIDINKTYEYIRRDKKTSVQLIHNQKSPDGIIHENQYDVKYWSYGFTSVFPMKNINVVGYITKYMTKDIDNRLWGKRRYLYSSNLKVPTTIYLDLMQDQDFLIYLDILNKCDKQFAHSYLTISGEDISFTEYKIRCDISPGAPDFSS